MMLWLKITCLAIWLVAPAAAAKPATPLDTLVQAERNFSATSVEKGMKSAFLTFMAEDGLLFRAGPINGRQFWSTRPESRNTLIWEPSFAEISGAGDFGITTGPWEIQPPKGDTLETGYGHFISVWKREPGGPWRVALDIGISHPKPEKGLGQVTLTRGPVHTMPDESKRSRSGLSVGGAVFSGGFGVGVGTTTGGTIRDEEYRRMAHEVHMLMSAERSLGWTMRAKNVARAYLDHATEDLRFYRPDAFPSLGIEAAIEKVGNRGRDTQWITRGNGVSASRDLGYTYGLVTTKDKGASRPDSSAYVHLWRKNPTGRWKLMLDIENPFPKR